MRKLSAIGLVGILCLSAVTKAQDYVGLSVHELQGRLQKQIRRQQQPKHALLTLAGTLETFTGVISPAIDIQLHCDSTGHCTAEQYLCLDEATAMQYLQKILAKKEYGWQPLNANQHVSVMERQRLLELYRLEDFWVVQVLLTNWSPLQYRLLFSTSVNTEK
ncbi:MAG: hypothetical protein ACKO41_04340 [Sphingomonadales bacterium]